MAKEFVRSIKDTTLNEPLMTNQQNDILSDTDNIYIRNKNNYFPLTKALLNINPIDNFIKASPTIDGINNKVDISINETNLKDFISKNVSSPEFNLTAKMIDDLLTSTNGITHTVDDNKVKLTLSKDLTQLSNKVYTNTSSISQNKKDITSLKSKSSINFISLNSNYSDVFNMLEQNTNNLNILKYNTSMYYPVGKIDTRYIFFNINRKTLTGFIDYEIIELTSTDAKLYATQLTPSEVKSI